MIYLKPKSMVNHRKKDTIEIYKEIGKRIAQFRNEQNLTQVQLAEKLGIKQQILAGYELATRRLPISMLKPIADVLFVKVEDILGLTYKAKPGPLSKIERKIEYIKSLPENKQKKILELIDSAINIAS
jgi:transcriptional regulator with XRE-family HTH domain